MRVVRSSNRLWSDDELADAVDAYAFLLRAQAAGLVFRREAGAAALLEEGLAERNDASLRYRFRNISVVVQALGLSPLDGYSPAEQVGAGVRERIKALLLANIHFNQLAAGRAVHSIGAVTGRAPLDAKAEALAALDSLRRQIEDVEHQVLGIGHNNPPEPLSFSNERRAIFADARADISSLEKELSRSVVDKELIAKHSERLLKFGVQLGAWLGQRTTKFIDVGLAALAPALALKVTGVLPAIIEALAAVGRVVTP